MADEAVVHTGGNTPEQVAYKLMHDIAAIEGKALLAVTGAPGAAASGRGGKELPDRKWLLDTYAECLLAVRHPDGRAAR
jgi:hypothetical protein